MTTTVVMAVVASIIAPIIPAIVASIVMPCLVTRHVFIPIPVVLHKVDPFVAGVVLTAVSGPVLSVAGGYVQVDRRSVHR
jgi:hypothetical protein